MVGFEQSDLLFVCMLKALSFEITLDEKEIEAAKVSEGSNQFLTLLFDFLWIDCCAVLLQWMPVDELLRQPFYKEDDMSRKIIGICIAKYDNCYLGFIAHQMNSKLDGKLSYLYCNESGEF